MKILALNTAEKSCSLALADNGRLVCESFCNLPVTHSITLMDMVNHLLTGMAGLTIDDMDGFVVAMGPGSFTGLRIGISVVKGLAFATSKPCAGVSSLDGIAWQFVSASRPVCAMMDAKRGEVYCAVYRFKNGKLVEKSREAALSPELSADCAGENAVFAGSGAQVHRQAIMNRLGAGADPVFVPDFQNHVKPAALAEVVFADPCLLMQDPGRIMPVYLRRSDAEITHEKTGS